MNKKDMIHSNLMNNFMKLPGICKKNAVLPPLKYMYIVYATLWYSRKLLIGILIIGMPSTNKVDEWDENPVNY